MPHGRHQRLVKNLVEVRPSQLNLQPLDLGPDAPHTRRLEKGCHLIVVAQSAQDAMAPPHHRRRLVGKILSGENLAQGFEIAEKSGAELEARNLTTRRGRIRGQIVIDVENDVQHHPAIIRIRRVTVS